MFRAVADYFKPVEPKREERFMTGPAFFDNNLGPIKWIWPQDDAENTQQHAFELAAFHACVRVIAESVASLPFHLIRENGDARERAKAHHLYGLVHDNPNPVQTSYELIETHVQHVAVWGNGYILKVFGQDGRVKELWPLHPSQVMPQQLSNNDVVYDYMPASPDEARRFSSGRIIHTRYISDNGYMGMVPVRLAAGVIEQARAMDSAAARFWANDARPGMILETSMPVPEQALVKLRQQWEQLHRGVENTGRTAVLPNGVSVKQLPPMTNEASQWTAVRTFCVEEVARQMRVPGSLVGLRTTYANSEQEALSWLQSIVPWCRRVESSFGRSLLEGMDGYSFQLDTRGMLRGDASTRASFYSSGLNNGWLTVNEVRRFEDMPRIELAAADEPFLAANNMRPMSQAYDLIGKETAPPEEPVISPAAEEDSAGSLESSRSMPPRDERGRFVSDRHCGTGAGGFKAGNTCAKGGGSYPTQAQANKAMKAASSEVSKAKKAVAKARAALASHDAKSAAKISAKLAKFDSGAKALDAKISKLKSQAAASSSRIDELKAKLAAMKKRAADDDIELLIDEELARLSGIAKEFDSIAEDARKIANEVEALT